MGKRTATQKTAKTVLETILEWSQDRPAWQRDALRRIVSKGRLDDGDLAELIELCKQGKMGSGSVPQSVPLTRLHLPANPGQGEAVSLVSIADTEGVNNLAPKQVLTFERSGITIIYGDNGAGKSGYARILKRACRARHSGKIEPSIYAQQPQPTASASITYSIGGNEQPSEKWEDAEFPHTILSAVSVFDAECASVHIKEKNEVAFRPFGLDVPDELAGVCQLVRDALTEQRKHLEIARSAIFLKPSWKEATAVGKLLAMLKHDILIERIEVLASLTEEEGIRLRRLREDLSKDLTKAIAEQTLKADNLNRLLNMIRLVELEISPEVLSNIASSAAEATSKRDAARLAANHAFSNDALNGIGGVAWRVLWDAARRYSMETAYPSEPFPPARMGVHCVLCQQPLDTDACNRMARFEDFIKNDTEKQAQEAETAYKTVRQKLTNIAINTRSAKGNLQEVALHDAALERRVRRFLASCRLRRHAFLRALEVGESFPPTILALPVADDLRKLENSIRDYATELKNSATAEERKKLDMELAELSDRALLSGMLQTVRDEVERLKNIHFLGECLTETTTTAITKLGNDIADMIITPQFRDRFQEEIVKLAAEKVLVEIVRSGGKHGSPQYQVRLRAKPEAKVQDILSEGEKTCVALAAFFTELATSGHTSSLVFDDPVSSLDHRWRKQVATRLVKEAAQRQIIVFTHDLVFVNDLYDLGSTEQHPMRLFRLGRGEAGAGVVTEGMPWKAQRIEERIDNLEKGARAAKIFYDKNQEEDYQREGAEVYGRLRASWERALEEIAFFRVIQRHRDYIDTKELKKVSALTGADCDAFRIGFKKCCDVVEAHDPSSGRNAVVPPPNELMQDIQTLKNWVKALRDRQKMIA